MSTIIDGNGISTGTLDLVTPLPVSEGGSGSSVIAPYQMVLGTAKAYNWNGLTTNTFLDFETIPSWVKRITVMLTGISTNGTSDYQIQIGSGTILTTTYSGSQGYTSGASSATGATTTGFAVSNGNAANAMNILMTINLVSGFSYVSAQHGGSSDGSTRHGGGRVTLSGTLDRIRLTTVNGTDAFDAGSCNIMYEGYVG